MGSSDGAPLNEDEDVGGDTGGVGGDGTGDGSDGNGSWDDGNAADESTGGGGETGGTADDSSADHGGAETGDSGVPGDSGGGDGFPNDTLEACYLGADESSTTCFPVVELDAYDYPSPPIGANYMPPIRFLDVDALDLTVHLAPNFLFSEISVPYKGQYQVVQPHAIVKVQQVRDQAGALTVKSGFRSPPYNAQQPGAATNSRHMWGDAFDLIPTSVTQNQLKSICDNLGAGYTATYTSGHVHCDWRDIPNDPVFYGAAAPPDFPPAWGADDLEVQIDRHVDGTLSARARGYDDTEGELTREWFAYDRDDVLLDTATTMEFTPPLDASHVEVVVGSIDTFALTL